MTNYALVGNFVINIVLSGALTFLWSMINCVQIVAHFDLVNITMPANAQFLFKILVQIATFNILPTESLIEQIESYLGIVNDDFTLTDAFIDFQFDSSGPIRNLQIMFLLMIFLIALPVFTLILRLLFFWNERCIRFIQTLNSKMFFNLFIRFGLEAYLEICLSSIIRFRNLTFETPSEKFHSIFASLLLAGVIGYLLFTLIFLQRGFPRLGKREVKQRYGDLYLGIRTSERSSVLSSFIFLLRRLTFASILISWSQRSYFQIQAIIFKCSLVMIYTGYFRPYVLTVANNLELINDTFIILCSYFLVVFSGLVSDKQTQYICGWPLIGLLAILISLNLGVIMFKGISQMYRFCRLRIIRRRNRAIHAKRLREKVTR